MVELIIEFVFEIFVELLIEICAQFAFEIGFETLSHSLRKGKKPNPILAYTGIAILGFLIGIATSLIFSERIVTQAPVKGLSLILSPILLGTLMHVFGNWRRQKGHKTSRLATFWGGALFAFSFALVRWVMVGSV